MATKRRWQFVVAAAVAVFTGAAAQQSPNPASGASNTAQEIERYRQALQEGNPAELWEARGEELWKTAAGPKKVSLERCDLGKGPGVVKGAYVELPRFFADTGRVMDLEQRLLWCRVHLQGLTEQEAKANPFAAPGRRSDVEALVAFITGASRGMPVKVAASRPEEQEFYRIGERIFFYRASTHDFSCATCHGDKGKRIRLQDLPDLLQPEGARAAWTTWPAYRVSQGEVRTMQHRLWDCFRQQRFPEPEYASDAITALQMFLAKNANGGTYDGPSIKR